MNTKVKWEDWFNHERLLTDGTYCYHRYYHTDENAMTISVSPEKRIKFFQIPFFNKKSPYAREGTNRLKLLAILSFVQSRTGNDFDFEKFVNNRFGIKSFQKAKSHHNKKTTYKEVLTKCNNIAKIMA